MIDLRSDTVTKPTPEMLNAMFNAQVGDDVFQEDESINKLQRKAAEMFGYEAGLFCPSGTMTNQIAVNVHTQPGDEIICSELCHIYNYEGAGVARNSGAQVKLIRHPKGFISAQDVENSINPADSHYARTSLVCLEDTVNKAGGIVYNPDNIQEVSEVCKTLGLKLHLDGARVFNALVENDMDYKEYGSYFDSMSICLSKGLGSPSGSVLVGSKEFIKEAHRTRKAMGGGMRQAGFIAEAGTYALQNNINRLRDDHAMAKKLAEILKNCAQVESVIQPETNIVIFDVKTSYGVDKFLAHLNEHNIKALPFSKTKIRFVTHMHIASNDIDEVNSCLEKL